MIKICDCKTLSSPLIAYTLCFETWNISLIYNAPNLYFPVIPNMIADLLNKFIFVQLTNNYKSVQLDNSTVGLQILKAEDLMFSKQYYIHILSRSVTTPPGIRLTPRPTRTTLWKLAMSDSVWMQLINQHILSSAALLWLFFFKICLLGFPQLYGSPILIRCGAPLKHYSG